MVVIFNASCGEITRPDSSWKKSKVFWKQGSISTLFFIIRINSSIVLHDMDFCAPCWFITFNSPGVGLGNIFWEHISQTIKLSKFETAVGSFAIWEFFFHYLQQGLFSYFFQGRGFSSEKKRSWTKKRPQVETKRHVLQVILLCGVAFFFGRTLVHEPKISKKRHQIPVVLSRLKFPLQNRQDWYIRGWVHNQTLRTQRLHCLTGHNAVAIGAWFPPPKKSGLWCSISSM